MSRERTLRRSIEVEYWVVDEEGRLVEPGELIEATEGAEREFVEPLLEIKTTPCETTAELRDELFERIGAVLRVAQASGRGLVPLSTPLCVADIADLPAERTRIQDRVVGPNFDYVRHCAGTHIHVEQSPGREIAQFNTLTALDPALALVNSAPYFAGERLAPGARSRLYRWMAYDELPTQGELLPYIETREEWFRRVDQSYETFVDAGVDAGIDRARIEAAFDPEDAIWVPVQLREEFSTVEWRSPDTALPGQVVRLADDVVSVVEQVVESGVTIGAGPSRLSDDAVVLPNFEAVRARTKDAIRHGVTSSRLTQYLERMGFDTNAYDPPAHSVCSGETLSQREARSLRLEYADRLAEDVQRRSRSVP